MIRCLNVLQNPDLTPRVLMRFVNFSRFLTASYGPTDPKVGSFVQFLTMEMANLDTNIDRLADGVSDQDIRAEGVYSESDFTVARLQLARKI